MLYRICSALNSLADTTANYTLRRAKTYKYDLPLFFMLQLLYELLIQSFTQQSELVAFIGSALFGTPFVILIASLAEHAFIPMWNVLIFSFLGEIVAGYIWFKMGKYIVRILPSRSLIKLKRLRSIARVLNKMLHRNKMHAFALPHVLYGTKIISFVYFGQAGITSREFIKYNVPIAAVWTTILVALGWIASKGMGYVGVMVDNFVIMLWISVMGCIILYLLIIWLTHWLSKRIRDGKIFR